MNSLEDTTGTFKIEGVPASKHLLGDEPKVTERILGDTPPAYIDAFKGDSLFAHAVARVAESRMHAVEDEDPDLYRFSLASKRLIREFVTEGEVRAWGEKFDAAAVDKKVRYRLYEAAFQITTEEAVKQLPKQEN